MRICIDATSLLLRSAGIKNYTWHWIRALQAEAPEHQVTAFPLLGGLGTLDHERSVVSLAATVPRIALLHAINRVYGGLLDVAIAQADVFHASNQVHAIPRRVMLTATVHDMTSVLMPEFHTAGNIAADKRFCDNILKRANGIIAVSESAKRDTVRILGIPPDRITVVYSGVDHRFFHVSEAEVQHVRSTFSLAKPYVLFVGTLEPRKNIDTLLDAWLSLPGTYRDSYDLILAGPIGWSAEKTAERVRSGIGSVRHLGYVPEADLPALTAGAIVFAYPSLYEGFGFPVAQALAAGVPVVTSNNSSLPEVVGDAGVLIEPRDTFALRDAMAHLLDSPDLCRGLGAKGRERAQMFTWKNSARASAEFFSRL